MRSVFFSDDILKRTEKDKIYQFVNCKLFREGKFDSEFSDLWVLNGRVLSPKTIFYELKRKADYQINCDGLVLAPGFIDIQVNGAFNVDFSSNPLETYQENVESVVDKLFQFGVTSFCPTIITSKPTFYEKVIPIIRNLVKRSKILGVHLEGPFISDQKRGCHPVENIISNLSVNPIDLVEKVYGKNLDSSTVSLVTIAPELPGALEAIEYFINKKIRVSIGHTNGTLRDADDAVNIGATCVTHIFNAMRPFCHREAGPIGLLTYSKDDTKIYYGIIADGLHNDTNALCFAWKTHPDGLLLVTDCISAVGLPNGNYNFGDLEIVVKDGLALKANTTTLAGSLATMPHCVRTFQKSTECSFADALRCATLNPASFLGIEDTKGGLSFGSHADFVLIDPNVDVFATFVDGCLRFCKN